MKYCPLPAARCPLPAARCPLLALALVGILSEALVGQTIGNWGTPFQHPSNGYTHPVHGLFPSNFEAINLAVIPNRSPTGLNANDVVIAFDIWYRVVAPVPVAWDQRFTVGNPEVPSSFKNYWVTIPLGPGSPGLFYGDLFCSGHCWLPDGRLFVAGGNAQYAASGTDNTGLFGNPGGGFLGSRFVGIWDPLSPQTAPTYGWTFLAAGATGKPMAIPRWYPTVTLISDRYVMVSGGQSDTGLPYGSDPAFNTYEVFDLDPLVMDWIKDPSGNPRVYPGPPSTGQFGTQLGIYPREHLLSNWKTFMSGSWAIPAGVRYDPTILLPLNPVWAPGQSSTFGRDGGCSVLVPNVGNIPGLRDVVMVIGGADYLNNVWDHSQCITAGAATPAWGTPQDLTSPRMMANAVLVPNGDIVLIGGCSTSYWTATRVPERSTEVWNRTDGWRKDGIQEVSRMYHSTAVLLPSGKIVSAGSDIREKQGAPGVSWEWEVYTPRNIANGQAIPSFLGAWANPGYMSMSWDTVYTIDYAVSSDFADVKSVVLMRPCSTTHASDMDQRYIELTVQSAPNGSSLQVKTPAAPNPLLTGQGSITTPPGWYMAFLVTTEGATSTAKWVQIQ